MKLLIAIPCYESIRPETAESIFSLERQLQEDGVAYDIKMISGTLVHCARDALARHAVNNNYDQVLWIDADMVFGKNIYSDLAMGGHDMTCGVFISRHSPYVSCLFSGLNPVERITEIPAEAFRVKACGFGMVLMKTEVLKAVMNNHGGRCFLPNKKLGEDCAFCQRVEGCGYEIWCEPSARVGHVGSLVIWPEDGERLRGEIHGLDGKKVE